MAYVKISELPQASLPLTGTEAVPMVQSGVTVQATVSRLTVNTPTVLTSIATLRLQAVPAAEASPQHSLVYNTAPGDGGGIFYLDASDHSSADNGTTIIVDSVGNRWKREIVQASYIANTPAGTVSSTTVQNAINEISGDVTTLTNNLAASSGASLVGFIQPGTGAVARTVQAKLRDFINVLDYGADPTGVTTNHIAFQNAMNAAGNNGTIYFPKGTYLLTDQVFPLVGQHLIGEGCQATVFQRYADYGNTLNWANMGPGSIEGIQFKHGSTVTPPASPTPLPDLATSGSHVYIGNMQFATIRNCWFYRMPYGVFINGGAHMEIDGCLLQGVWSGFNVNAQEGIADIVVGGGAFSENVIIKNCELRGTDSGAQTVTYTSTDTGAHAVSYSATAAGSQYGIYAKCCEGLQIFGNYMGGHQHSSIFLEIRTMAGSTILANVRITANYFDGDGWQYPALYIAPSVDGLSIAGLVITGNTFNGQQYCEHAILAENPAGTSSHVGNFEISANSFYAYSGSAVILDDVTAGSVSSNTISGYNCKDVSAGGDPVFSNAVYVLGSTSVLVENNVFGGNAGDALPGGYTYVGVSFGAGNVNVTAKDNFANGLGASVNQLGRQDNGVYTFTAAGNYTMTGDEEVIVVNKTVGAATQVTLPSNMTPGYTCTIKDGKGDAATNNITIVGTIDGVANTILSSNYQSLTLMALSSGWATVSDSRDLISNSASQGVGFGTGAGGAITQGTSRTTGVTLDTMAGAITLFSAAGSATPTSFTVTNSRVAATDTIILSQKSGTDKYILAVTAVAAGSFQITFYTTGGTTTEQPVFNFVVIKGATS